MLPQQAVKAHYRKEKISAINVFLQAASHYTNIQ